MARTFDRIFLGEPFTAFNGPHLLSLALILAVNLSLILLRPHPIARARRAIRRGLAGALLFLQVCWLVWVIAIGEGTIDTLLPLHLCSLFTLVTAVMLFTGDTRLFDYAYYLGSGGALCALLFPDVSFYNFPHFVFIQTFLVHGLLLTSQVYLAAVEGWRPSAHAVRKALIFSNVYIAAVFLFDTLTGSNYLFLAYKPEFPTPLDYFGPWPWYLLGIEAAGILVFLILRLPFASAAKRTSLITAKQRR